MNKYHNDTIIKAFNELWTRGYIEDLNLRAYCLECSRLQLELGAGEFRIDEVHRFDGASNLDDRSVVYAISSDRGVKGVLVDACGTYADAVTPEMALKFNF